MSDHAATTTSDAPLFTPLEVEQFEADDVVAGAAIGKMLSLLFLYTVLAMSFVVWWTYSSLSEHHNVAETSSAHSASH